MDSVLNTACAPPCRESALGVAHRGSTLTRERRINVIGALVAPEAYTRAEANGVEAVESMRDCS